MYKLEDILATTDDGLEIIGYYYPDAVDAARNNKKFKMRADEKTPSATIRKRNNVWKVCDFGGEGREVGPFDLAMQEENVTEFPEIIKRLGERYGVAKINGDRAQIKPDFSKRPATGEEKEGEYFFEIAEAFTEKELKTLGRFVKEEHCQQLNCHALISYTYIKNREALTFKSTEDYPQFLFDWGDFKKLYKPKEQNKAFRFLYIGEKPKNVLFGMDNVRRIFKKREEGTARSVTMEEDIDEEQTLLPEIILASGERDALNILSAGLIPVWKNSETALLTHDHLKEILTFADKLVNIPDIDSTGIEKARELGLRHLDIHTAWLPNELKLKKDWRGNPCKDTTDFLQHYSTAYLKKIVNNSLCFRPWDKVIEYDKNENIKAIKFVINNAQAYEFLYAHGFQRIEKKNEKTGFTFIRVNKNVVQEIKPSEIKYFVHQWLKNNGYDVKLRNIFYRTTQLNENSLSGNLDVAELDFSDNDSESQLFFFQNKIVKVSKEGYDASSSENYVWEDEVIKHNFRKLKPFFTWSEKDGKLHIDSIDESFSMVKFIMNTSRIFWRKEKEGKDGKKGQLTEEEIRIQNLHFLNKCYSLGYLLHRYKNPSRPWAVFAIDSKDGAIGESNGGSGKSITYKLPTFFMQHVNLNGRDKNLTKNSHIFDRVNENTDYILVDDATRETDFHFFFSSLTGDFQVNPKHASQFEIPFDKSPRFAFTSNHILRNIDASTERRLLYTVFSDYYHKKDASGAYNEDMTPADEFGKNLIFDYTPDEMNQFYNFMLQCVQFYLQYGRKLDPPMDNVEKRMLRSKMGDNFFDWALFYFVRPEDGPQPDVSYIDCEVPRKQCYEAYQNEVGDKYTKPKLFKDKVVAFCKYMGYEFNPIDKCTDIEGRRILKSIDGRTQEVFYIKTTDEEPVVDNIPDWAKMAD